MLVPLLPHPQEAGEEGGKGRREASALPAFTRVAAALGATISYASRHDLNMLSDNRRASPAFFLLGLPYFLVFSD